MIKVVATDMDGTFLNSRNDYDRKHFKVLFEKMTDQGIRFVSISGNQYYQIQSFFPELKDRITFVGENGAYIVENGSFIKSHRLSNDTVRLVLDYLIENKFDHELVLCGEQSAYILQASAQEVKDYFSIYYHRLTAVETFAQLPDDNFMKFSFNTPENQTYAIVDALNDKLEGKVVAVTSGHGNIDVIAEGVNKGTAMAYLLDRWGVTAEELAAFGDGGNDIEMLKLAKYSYAMSNGSADVKAAASAIAPSNDDSGVLKTIEKLLI
ncbi:Cof-type HAD-IIB family hydrolase [Streptococcus sp. H49]|uniref:Cof-type HAD-IIB family hydrolase n=1 Tax=Streptococcus huangxiaojuni TaxID=3237239 RepID=UPI0034A53A54